MTTTTSFSVQLDLFGSSSRQKSIIVVPVAQLQLSRFNPRVTRPGSDVQTLAERMIRNGFEITRAPWVHAVDDSYAVFAGGTRLLAAERAGLAEIPVVLHDGLTDDEIVRLADEDNENDGYHHHVPITDTWAEYWRLNKEEGWTQQRIADAKGVDRATVTYRIGWHEKLPQAVRRAVCDGVLDEGHIQAISTVMCDVTLATLLSPWLTTEQAQTELTQDILGKHRGSTIGIKPTVKNVREQAAVWKVMIAAAEQQYRALEAP